MYTSYVPLTCIDHDTKGDRIDICGPGEYAATVATTEDHTHNEHQDLMGKKGMGHRTNTRGIPPRVRLYLLLIDHECAEAEQSASPSHSP